MVVRGFGLRFEAFQGSIGAQVWVKGLGSMFWV